MATLTKTQKATSKGLLGWIHSNVRPWRTETSITCGLKVASMGYVLLTGATGLLGQYVLRDLLLADIPVVVLARSTSTATARQRINSQLAREEGRLGRAILRPVVFDGDLNYPSLAAEESQRQRLAEICTSVLNCAASITFYRNGTGEPYRTNLEGTRNLLAFCQDARIRHLHHVSTAYVCGLRRERIYESDLNDTDGFGNDYESSKFQSEQLIRDAFFLESATVYRPSIIVGDSTTGFTSTFHGFYTPLQLGIGIARRRGFHDEGGKWLLGQLQLQGDERKNLVPVDWVSAVITYVVQHPECHGSTYHLTNPSPVTTELMERVFTDSAREMAKDPKTSDVSAEETTVDFRDNMGAYRSYLRNDPEFDCSNTLSAVAHLPCPTINYQRLMNLARFALGANFGWPRPVTTTPLFDVESHIDELLQSDKSATTMTRLGLEVSGSGGGVWQIDFQDSHPRHALRGLDALQTGGVYTTVDVVKALLNEELSIEFSVKNGRLIFFGSPEEIDQSRTLFSHLIEYLVKRRKEQAMQELNLRNPGTARREVVA